MDMKKTVIFMVAAILALNVFLIQGCAAKNDDTLKDGYYTAEMSDYSHGWKEFLTIFVRGGDIVSAEYNARNSSGFIKSWDMAYMRNMNAVQGTYPNRYTRTYASELLADQSADDIDVVTGASTSYGTFQQLANAVIGHAKAGDSSIAIVQSANEE